MSTAVTSPAVAAGVAAAPVDSDGKTWWPTDPETEGGAGMPGLQAAEHPDTLIVNDRVAAAEVLAVQLDAAADGHVRQGRFHYRRRSGWSGGAAPRPGRRASRPGRPMSSGSGRIAEQCEQHVGGLR